MKIVETVYGVNTTLTTHIAFSSADCTAITEKSFIRFDSVPKTLSKTTFFISVRSSKNVGKFTLGEVLLNIYFNCFIFCFENSF